MKVDGKTVVITGGATGIGLALGRELGKCGARLILFEPRAGRLAEAAADLTADGIDAKTQCGDVTDPDALKALADFAWAENGRADMLINNAGIGGSMKSVIKTDPEEARRIFEVNFWGMWKGISEFGRRFLAEEKPAAIYSVASENALFNAFPFGGGAYVASKHAIFGLMDVLRREAPEWLTTGVIIPGWVQSELSDFNRTAPAAMDVGAYAAIIAPQIEAGEYYVVSHGYNVVRFDERYDEMKAAFAEYAPREEGDDQYDVQKFVAKMQR
ncbi:SDR family NAD(P)-dependent oxidoreductase [Parasphingorhabdus cellanae]|uniref:SDR family NAD(P)-dependent oxidoreductase n=1 Tax=Parasphingorhabdus cellanae TaxID=2806553 RepID=A0ABX7T3E3_9SPHN|nr:SDR family NAD(P)-dependent oxidoreductase [Parasphingorhabdus cellanae]QTD55473.1 SDR family NAD(P)-dependent oxidoreductase [Parasphingorhabdus cellanae]